MTDNPFSRLANEQIANPVKSRLKAVETRRARAAQAEKDLLDEAKLLKLYRKEKRRRVMALLDDPRWGESVRALISFMRTMTLADAPSLVRRVKSGKLWIACLPEDHKYILLHLISQGISKVREKNNLPPFDDPLPDQPDKAFQQIQKAIGAS